MPTIIKFILLASLSALMACSSIVSMRLEHAVILDEFAFTRFFTADISDRFSFTLVNRTFTLSWRSLITSNFLSMFDRICFKSASASGAFCLVVVGLASGLVGAVFLPRFIALILDSESLLEDDNGRLLLALVVVAVPVPVPGGGAILWLYWFPDQSKNKYSEVVCSTSLLLVGSD